MRPALAGTATASTAVLLMAAPYHCRPPGPVVSPVAIPQPLRLRNSTTAPPYQLHLRHCFPAVRICQALLSLWATRETITTPAPNVYSSQHRFLGARAGGNLPHTLGRTPAHTPPQSSPLLSAGLASAPVTTAETAAAAALSPERTGWAGRTGADGSPSSSRRLTSASGARVRKRVVPSWSRTRSMPLSPRRPLRPGRCGLRARWCRRGPGRPRRSGPVHPRRPERGRRWPLW
jgi:hypothetical protein